MVDLLTDTLACYRLTRLAVEDSILDGPRAHVRNALKVAGYDRALEFTRCPWCLSVWIGLGVVVARRAAPRAWPPIAWALACSTVAGAASTYL